MNVEYSKQFIKAAQKLSGKYKKSLQRVVVEIKQSKDISEVTDCIKLSGIPHTYRLKMGDYRIVFILRIVEHIVFFELLLSRGEVYKKRT